MATNITMALLNQSLPIPEAYITASTYGKAKVRTKGAPSGMANSIHSPGLHQAVWNQSFTVLTKIVTGEYPSISAVDLFPQDSVYLEITKSSGEVSAYVINGNEIASNVYTPDNFEMLVAVTAYFLGKNDQRLEEVQELYRKIADQIATTGKADYETALKYCDSFMYTLPQFFNLNAQRQPTIKRGETLTDESIKELSRFTNAPRIIDFSTINKSEGKFVYYDMPKQTTPSAVNTNPNMPIIERCRAGEFIIPWEWSAEDKLLIPSMNFLDLYIPNEDFEDALNLIKYSSKKILENLDRGKSGEEAIGNYGKCLAFIGKPGTGKSTMIKAIAAACQIPFYPCTTTRFSEEDEYQGKTKLDHSNEDTKAAAFKFCETPFLNAFEKGGIAVLEEFNLADPGMLMGAIGQAIEKPFIIEKDGYLPTKRHPLCIICFTCNVGTQGSQMPSEALFSRAPHVFNVEDPPEDSFIEILLKQTENVTRTQVANVFDTYKRLMNMLKTENMPELMKVLTLRHCLAALDQIAAGVSFKRATSRTLINPLRVYAPEIADDFYSSVIDTAVD